MSDSLNPLADLRAAIDLARSRSINARWPDAGLSVEEHAAWGALSTALAAAEAEREGMREALKKIAAYDDEGGNHMLKSRGSYASFDEPGSVEIARRALNSEPSDAK